jgi:hypothetical protein
MLIKLIAAGAFGLVFLSTTTTLYISNQLERSQCASLVLPIGYKIMVGSRCKTAMADDDRRFSVRDASRPEDRDAAQAVESPRPTA